MFKVGDTINDILAGVVFDFTGVTGFSAGITGFGVRGIETSALLDPIKLVLPLGFEPRSF